MKYFIASKFSVISILEFIHLKEVAVCDKSLDSNLDIENISISKY